MTQMIESTAGSVAADIERLRVAKDAPVLVFVGEHDELERLRQRARPKIEADGLTDEDLDALIDEARGSIRPV